MGNLIRWSTDHLNTEYFTQTKASLRKRSSPGNGQGRLRVPGEEVRALPCCFMLSYATILHYGMLYVGILYQTIAFYTIILLSKHTITIYHHFNFMHFITLFHAILNFHKYSPLVGLNIYLNSHHLLYK